MFNNKLIASVILGVLHFASPVQASFLLSATYTDWTQSGPLSFGLSKMPDEFIVTFALEPIPPTGTPPTPPGVPVPYPNFSWVASNVLTSSVTFGDATWNTLASFDFEIDDGELYLDYVFEPLPFTLTSQGGIVLNAPLKITGIDLASGESFIYEYGTRTLSLVQVSEAYTLALLSIGIVGIGKARRRIKL